MWPMHICACHIQTRAHTHHAQTNKEKEKKIYSWPYHSKAAENQSYWRHLKRGQRRRLNAVERGSPQVGLAAPGNTEFQEEMTEHHILMVMGITQDRHLGEPDGKSTGNGDDVVRIREYFCFIKQIPWKISGLFKAVMWSHGLQTHKKNSWKMISLRMGRSVQMNSVASYFEASDRLLRKTCLFVFC